VHSPIGDLSLLFFGLPPQPACVLKDALAGARDAFLAALERYTLADLVAPRRKLAALLNPQPRPL